MSILNQVLSGLAKPSKQDQPATTASVSKTAGTVSSSHNSSLINMPSPGEVLRGEVTDLRWNQVSVLLENGSLVCARTEGDLPLVIGQKASFFVSQTSDSQITLKLADNDESAEQKMIDKVLQSAGLQKNERTIAIVSTLLEHQQPVNEAGIRHYMMLSAKYPEIPVKDFVLMELHQIPVNSDTVSQFQQYNEGTHQLLSQADAIISELWKQLSSLSESSVRDGFLTQLRAFLLSSQSTQKSQTGFPSSIGSENNFHSESLLAEALPNSSEASDLLNRTEFETNSSVSSSTLIKNASSLSEVLPSKNGISSDQLPSSGGSLPQGETSVNHSLSSVTISSDSMESDQTSMFDSFDQFKQALIQNFLLKPEQLSQKDAVSTYYKRLEEQVSSLHLLADKLSKVTSSGQSDSAVNQMQSNLSFMDTINQIFPYIQLPLMFKDKPVHGELYVYERKKTLAKSESLSALLHLDLDALGTTDIFVTLHGTAVSAKFYLSDDSAKQLVAAQLPQLSDSLHKKGYSLQSEVATQKTKSEGDSRMEQFLEEHSPTELHRYTFDIRA